MTDPYQVLGIASTASDDEVKKAYRTLSKKYHPDANVNNPNRDAYTAKFKEVQNAYDQIMDMRRNGTSYQSQSQYQQGYGNAGGYYHQNQQYQYKEYQDFSSFFRDFAGGYYQNQNSQSNRYQSKEEMYYSAVKNYIRQGCYAEGYNVLSQMSERGSLWYYYSAICNGGLGNNATALEHAKQALDMEPTNVQYQQLYQQMQSGRMRYHTQNQSYQNPMAAYADCCYKMLLCNIMLNCCCGRGMICC